MSSEVKSTNPIVQAVVEGRAPAQARLAAARGMLPLAQDELLEVLVSLRSDADPAVSGAAEATLAEQEPAALLTVASSPDAPPPVLAYLAEREGTPRDLQEALALNAATPDEAVAALARMTSEGAVLEIISINQQRLIRARAIIDAIVANPARTPEAERRA
ncbi:MAG TPA: hypothetical protein VK422_16720, partial [Pyrinomonadaceae bacterium]|nr:hypothetical protein [Pyrinomonadaceae bacterium]